MIINIKKISYILLILFLGCTKEINISEFEDDFSGYESELRVEALILSSENKAIIRIDRSVLINDQETYNCIDDDGDWNPNLDDTGTDGQIGDPTDENGNCEFGALENDPCFTEPSVGEGNGVADCGEPHVDEIDEIITQLHLNSCSIYIKNHNDNSTCNFEYNEAANSYWFFPYNKTRDNVELIEESYYGGYIPDQSCIDINFNWNDEFGQYDFKCDCGDYGVVVSKEPIQISQPVVFFNESDVEQIDTFLSIADNCSTIDCLQQTSTLWDSNNGTYQKRYFARYAIEDYIYYSSMVDYLYYQSVQYFYDENQNNDGRWIYYHGHPDAATDACDNCGIHNNITTMQEAVVTQFLEFDPENLPPVSINQFYYEMFTFSDSYKNYYFYDQLDLLDPVRTNLRIEGTNIPVMGAFGAMASEKIYFDIIDCEDYDTPEDCENQGITKSVCRWYPVIGDYENVCLPKKMSNLN